MKPYYFHLLIILSIFSCVPASDEIPTEVEYSVNNIEVQRAYNYQDKYQLDSVMMLFSDHDPTMRFIGANALSSHESSRGVDSLIKLLQDPSPLVKQAAAYALGQQRNGKAESALLGSLQLYDSISYNNVINSTIMEAVGKLGSVANLDALATAANIKPTDNKILLGQVRGIYRYLLDGKISNRGTARMFEVVSDRSFPHDARIIAANYFSRAQDLDLEASKFQLVRVLTEEQNPDIQLALANALKHVSDPDILKAIMELINGETDYRVKVNLLKHLGNYRYIQVIEKVLSILNDENIHVANSAADYLIANGQPADASLYRNFVKKDMHWSTKAKIYESVLTHLPRSYSSTRIRTNNAISKAFKASENPFEQSAYIRALSADVVNFKIIHDLGVEAKSPIVNSAMAAGYNNILANPKFNRAYKSTTSRTRTKTNILKYLQELIETGETGAVTESSNILANEDYGFQDLEVNFDFLNLADGKLELPRQVEASYAIKSAIANVTGTTYQRATPTFNNPIDWSMLDDIGDSTRVNIITEKGNVILKLFAQEAPGSVANFVRLAKSNYYDDKVFHRVVPGFVIQGGCPIGNGYGSQDYTIRSEFSQLYYDKAGMVGMASAGSHTEGVQFFITQAPTPHLDGKYTIFGEVVSGIETVHNIHVGDKIQDVQIVKL